MEAEIRLLEDRVRRAVERIRALTSEKSKLSNDVRTLRAELDRLGRDAKRSQKTERRDPEIAAWSASLREAIRELRGS
jgi:uncharacterized protein (UPF0335 family)